MFGPKKNPLVTDSETVGRALNRRLEPAGIFPSREAVVAALTSGPKKVYLGIDPTGPDIHLGHSIPILFLKQLWQLGHTPVIVIGDFTARIGDPTGKSSTRRPLAEDEIKQNERSYISQIERILPKGSFEVRHNGDWLSRLSFDDVLKLTAQVTVQQMIQRDMFQERLKNNQPIGLHEFLYPLMQGYDSVAMEIDGEVGGNDQTFNMLVGRDLEKKLLGNDKLVFATRLLVDAASGKKMSKSEGELIALSDTPQEIRRKVLAIDDAMSKTVFELCTENEESWIAEEQKKSPREQKEDLADELVRMYHGDGAVEDSRKARGVSGAGQSVTQWAAGVTGKSNSEIKNLIDQGGIEINGQTNKDWHYELKSGDKVKIGKGEFFEVN